MQIGPPASLGLKAPGNPGRAVASADGESLVVPSAARANEALVFHPRTGEMQARLSGPSGLWFLDISPDGELVAGGCQKTAGGVRVWDARSGRTVLDLPVEGDAMVGFSPDGAHLLTGNFREFRSWEVGSWRSSWMIPREEAGGFSGLLAFSPDGNLLALERNLSDVLLVEAATGREIARLPAPDLQIPRWLQFSPSGRDLWVATEQNAIQVWDLYAIRNQLADIRLDWDHPPLPPPPEPDERKPLKVEVDLGELSPR